MTNRLALALTLLFTSTMSAAPLYVRTSFALERSRDTTLNDRNCASVVPPALFGCVEDANGDVLAARGDFGESASFELAIGAPLSDRIRVDVSVARRSGLELVAEANFVGVTGEQPVHANADATTLLFNGAYDFGAETWRVRPFLTAGAGVTRNRMDAVAFAFPSIAPDAVTLIQGGMSTDFAWTAGGGVSLSLTPRLSLELVIRHTDLGELRTDDGPAEIVRPRGTLLLDIAGTRADLAMDGVGVGLRYTP